MLQHLQSTPTVTCYGMANQHQQTTGVDKFHCMIDGSLNVEQKYRLN